MGKRIAFLMTLVMLVVALAFVVGCGGGETPAPQEEDWESDATGHWKGDAAPEAHTFGEWQTTTEAVCVTAGEQQRVCSVCEYTEKEDIAAPGHPASTTWKKDNREHWHETTCAHKEKVDVAGHTFSGGACTVCKMVQPATEGIVLTKEGTTYTLTSVPAGLKGAVVIPSAHEYLKVTKIAEGVFDGQSEITEIILSENITEIPAYAFRDCVSLTAITIPEKVTKINKNAFSGCVKLKTITIPARVTLIDDYAFNGCTDLETVTYAGTPKLKTIGTRAFADCPKLATVTIPESVTTIGASAFTNTAFANTDANYESGVLYSGKYLLYVKPDTAGTVVVKSGTKLIANRAFNNCTEITSVTVPDGVTTGKNVYDGCDKLVKSGTLVTEGDFVFMNGTTGYEMVAYNGTATAVTLPASVQGAGYVIRAYAFAGNETIISVTIPAGVTAIGAHAFDGCTALTTVSMGADVASIGAYAFSGCEALTDAGIGAGVATIGENAYGGCVAMLSVRIPDSVETIGKKAFVNCASLESVYMGAGLVSVDEQAFYLCRAIDNIYITDLAAWCGVAFADKEAHPFGAEYTSTDSNKFYLNEVEVTALVIPDGVSKIECYAFYNCDRITSLTIGADVKTIGIGAFRSFANGGITTLNCSTTGWKRGTTLSNGIAHSTLTAEDLAGADGGKYYFYIEA